MKKIIQRNLPLNVSYKLNGVSYQSIEDGGGCACDNCGKLITNVAHLTNESKNFFVGLDCLDTILENNKLLNDSDYIEYLYSDKPAIAKAKSLRAKLIKYSKKYQNFKAEFKQFENCFGFRFSYNDGSLYDNQLGYDYTYNIKYMELTLNYVKGLDYVFINQSHTA